MAFVLKAKAEGFFYPIQLPVVTEAGSTQVIKFEFKFKRISRSKLNELQRMQDDLTKGDIEVDSLERDTDYVLEIAEGWRYVQDDAGKDVPFNREAVRLMLDSFPNAASAIVSAFFQATLGGGKKGN
jgi:hypothetical protein